MILQQMKRRTAATLCVYGPLLLLFGVVGLLNFAAAENETEWMPDANLRQAVREALKLAPDASLTPQVLEGLTELQAGAQEISDLKGLEYATRLEVLNLSENSIIDITPLVDLRDLTQLNLYANLIIDITSLARLTRLKQLELSYNSVRDIIPLIRLTNLTQLNLNSNKIMELTPLARLTGLKQLELEDNQVVDITPLANLTGLTLLDLGFNRVVDITPLANLTGLTLLDLGAKRLDHLPKEFGLEFNQVVDITPLSSLTSLTKLNLQANQVTDITPLANLTELKQVDLSENEISDITPLIDLTRLAVLDLTNNPTQDITTLYTLRNRNPNLSLQSPIPLPEPGLMPDGHLAEGVRKALGLVASSRLTREELQNLKKLFLTHSLITDLTGLEHATRLETLYLSENEISDIRPLADLTRLETLYLSNNEISDIRPLADLTRLETLGLWNNKISDITPLANLMELETLYLSNNEISALTPLATLSELKALGLQANQVENIKVLKNLTELERLNLADNEIRDITPLANLTELQTLDLETNQIRDIDALTQLTNLNWLDLQSNQIRDISGISTLTNLKGLTVKSNPIQDVTPLRILLESNQKMTIDVAFIGASPCPLMYWIDMRNGTFHCRVGDAVVNLLPDIQSAITPLLNSFFDAGASLVGDMDIRNATSLALNGFDYYWTEKTKDKAGRIWYMKNESGAGVRIIDSDDWEIQWVKELTEAPTDMIIAEGHCYLLAPSGKIQRLRTSGGDFQRDFITGLASPKNLVVDAFGKKLYWTEETPDGTWHIRGVPLDGSNVQSVRTLESAPLGLAIDVSTDQLYVSVASGKIQRLRVDGSDFQRDFITGLAAPESLSVDVGGGKVYWTEKGGIWRASLNGENIEQIVTGLGMPAYLVLDVATRAR